MSGGSISLRQVSLSGQSDLSSLRGQFDLTALAP